MRELTEKETLNKKHFLMFMELIGLSPTSRNAYATSLMSCSDFIKDVLEKDGYTSLYEVDNQKFSSRRDKIIQTSIYKQTLDPPFGDTKACFLFIGSRFALADTLSPSGWLPPIFDMLEGGGSEPFGSL